MAFIDFLKKDSKKLSHIKNLIAVASADGRLYRSELAGIAAVLARENMSPEDFDYCLKNPEKIKFTPPTSNEERVRYLTDMVLIMMADGKIDKSEYAICWETAIELGFRDDAVNIIIDGI